MKAGFIGAGKVGTSFGKYFVEHGEQVSGYFSRTKKSAQEAAEFTGSVCYETMSDLIRESDMIFLTVPDGTIKEIWEQITSDSISLAGKIICHTSGSISSSIFSGIESKGAVGCSVHPLFAISDRFLSYKELSKAVFTIEGQKEKIAAVKQLFVSFGNKVAVIAPEVKAKYHAAAVMTSNLVTALYEMGADLLLECGFSENIAKEALIPLFQGNVKNIISQGTVGALTGPVERNDITTVKRHQNVLNSDEWSVYCGLSKKLIEIAKQKHKEADYSELSKLFCEDEYV